MKTNFLSFRNFAKSALMLLLFSIPILGQIRSDTGSTCSGTLSMTDGKVKKEVPLKYVYATYVLSGAGLQIVLSDKPLPENYWDRRRYIEVLSNEGRLSGLVIQIDTQSKNVEVSAVYSELSLDPSSGATEAWRSRDARKQVFEPKVMNAKTVTGTLYSNSIPREKIPKELVEVRLVLEEGQWKVFWVLDGDLQANIFAENYKN